jgi:two-component system, chemotaxis family, protein-glutamate methylesterase/glutaminase
MIKVLVVEDSLVVREFLVHLLNSAGGIRVIGTAADGDEALEFVGRERPDVIAMDINMPRMNGIEATRRIMETRPVPIVIVSGIWNPKEVETTFRAMEAGALAVVQKPRGIGHPDHEATVKELVQKVKLMSEVKLVRRWPKYRDSKRAEVTPANACVGPSGESAAIRSIKMVAVGASTGGPPVLYEILTGFPQNFPAPLVIVQHIAPGFTKGMVDWISGASRLKVKIAADGEKLLPGHAYFAPEHRHMGVRRDDTILLSDEGEEDRVCPSVSHLFRSVADAYGCEAVGILLTGMGGDGARELKLMKDRGAVTIIQDRESAAVYGMPGVAEEMGAASYVLPPGKIVDVLIAMTNHEAS